MNLREPDCEFMTVTKTADSNEGLTEFYCPVYNWKHTKFNLDTNGNILSRNEDCFSDCQRCPNNKNI